MPYAELLGWYDYFERRPLGWREDDRTAKLLQAQGVKGSAWKLFPSLEPIYRPKGAVLDVRQSGFMSRMLQAKGGAQVPL